MLLLGSVKGLYQAKIPKTPFFPWPVPPSPHLQCWGATSWQIAAVQGTTLHLAGGEDGVSACRGADRHLRRGTVELQRDTLLPSLTASHSPLKVIPPKHPRSLMKWVADLTTSSLGPQ